MAGKKVISASQPIFLRGLINVKTLRLSSCAHRNCISEMQTDRKGSLPHLRCSTETLKGGYSFYSYNVPSSTPSITTFPKVRLKDGISVLTPNVSFAKLCWLPSPCLAPLQAAGQCCLSHWCWSDTMTVCHFSEGWSRQAACRFVFLMYMRNSNQRLISSTSLLSQWKPRVSTVWEKSAQYPEGRCKGLLSSIIPAAPYSRICSLFHYASSHNWPYDALMVS